MVSFMTPPGPAKTLDARHLCDLNLQVEEVGPIPHPGGNAFSAPSATTVGLQA